MYKRILLPLDGSPQARQALPHAIAQAERFGAQLMLLRVLTPSQGVHSLDAEIREWVTRYKASLARENLDDAATAARERGIPVVICTAKGHAATEVTEFARENGIDLIVIGSRKRPSLSRLLMGSVTDCIVRDASVPVLLVQAENR